MAYRSSGYKRCQLNVYTCDEKPYTLERRQTGAMQEEEGGGDGVVVRGWSEVELTGHIAPPDKVVDQCLMVVLS